jgi:hypothetical protein
VGWELEEKKIKKRKNYDKDKEGTKKVHSSTLIHPNWCIGGCWFI